MSYDTSAITQLQSDISTLQSNLATLESSKSSAAAAADVTPDPLEMSGNNVTLTATTNITIQVGSNSITITSSGITINGSAVDLPAGSTVDGETIITADVYDVHTHTFSDSAAVSGSTLFTSGTDFSSHNHDLPSNLTASVSGSTAAPS